MTTQRKGARTRSWLGVAAAAALAAGMLVEPIPGALAAGDEEQPPKNVKILTGLSALQLQRTMNFIRGSLGVHCDHCHAFTPEDGGKWDFPSDEKATKRTARKMIQMVADINRTTFDGRPVVSCFTCHHGSLHPVRELPLPQAPPPWPTPPPPPDPAAGMPAPERILDRYVQALGGGAAVAKLRARHMRGVVVTLEGRELPLEVDQAAPDRYLSKVTTQGGEIVRGFNGEVAWTKTGDKARLLTDGEAEQMRALADFWRDLRFQDRLSGLKTLGRLALDGGQADVIEGMRADGRTERLFFDTATGLLVRRIVLMPTLVGLVPEQIDFNDYRDAGGIKLPFVVRLSDVDPWVGMTRRYEEIRIDAPIDPSRFDPPAGAS